ncbi:cytochrome P450 [Colletotrichum cuscutae]|uniref:Cytochrome P450 monooxygenase ABA1 n=1 Tax=Colletotrichum cuscutae TaxID=1209917 RepID=A0AAI9TY92_9PEZI|nr:cytochrome P450 [Colletotrichum cuscutae]
MGLISQLYSLRWLFAAILVAVYVGQKIRTYNRLRAFKGPVLCGWTEAWHAWAILTFKSHLKYDEVCRKYGEPFFLPILHDMARAEHEGKSNAEPILLGTIARVGPNDLITSSPELLVYMSGIRSPYTRTEWYYRACRHMSENDHVFSEMDEEKHRVLRQRMGAGYSGKENLALEDSVDTHVSELVQLIRSKYMSTEFAARPMDLAMKMQYLTLDVISNISYGKPFGDLRADEDMFGVAESAEVGMTIFTYKIGLGLYKILQKPIVARLLGPKETDASGFGRMFANGRAIIKERLARDTEKRSDMIASFIRHGLSEDEILSETTLQMIAGSDTTAASLRIIMLYLLTHARVYAKLQAEIDVYVRDGQIGSRPSGIVSDAENRRMPYLQAVIKEGMRVHPPVTNMDPKRVPDGGDTVVVNGESVFLPGGTNINAAAWPMHLSKEIFGEDADEFRPERWLLEEDERRLVNMHRVHELIFGYGKYQCLGRPIAMMEIGKTIFELMRNFDWCLARPDTPWKEANHAGVFTHNDMWVLASERPQFQ